MISTLVTAYGKAQFVAGWLHGHDRHDLMNFDLQFTLKAAMGHVRKLEDILEENHPILRTRMGLLTEIVGLRHPEARKKAAELVVLLEQELDDVLAEIDVIDDDEPGEQALVTTKGTESWSDAYDWEKGQIRGA